MKLILTATRLATSPLHPLRARRGIKGKVKPVLLWLSFGIFGLGAILLVPGNASANACATPVTISFPYAVQADTQGAEFKANSSITGNVYSNGNITGELFAKITGNASAVGTISTVAVSGTKTSGAASVPLPSFNAADWESAAQAGGVTTGDVTYPVNSSGNSLGPKKIIGNLTLLDNSDVTITGNLYVTGNITIGANAKLHLSPTFIAAGTVIIAEGRISIAGNAKVDGTTTGGFLLMVSTSNLSGNSLVLEPNFKSTTTVFYSTADTLLVGANSQIIGAYGKRVQIDANARVNFASALNFASFVCPVPPSTPAIVVNKSATLSQAVAGQNFTYSLSVQNTGTGAATSVVVQDTLQSPLVYTTATPLPNTVSAGAGGTTLTWISGTINSGGAKSLTISVATPASLSATTTVSNFAVATGSNFASVTSPAVEVIIVPAAGPPVPGPAVSVTKSATTSAANAGEQFSYLLDVKNTGTAVANNVLVSDILQNPLIFVSSTPAPTSLATTTSQTTLNWDLGSLSPGATSTIAILVSTPSTLTANVTVNNSASVAGANFASVNSNSVAVEISAPAAPPPAGGGGGGFYRDTVGPLHKAILEFLLEQEKIVGQTYADQIIVRNPGGANLPEGILVLTLPLELEYVSASQAPVSRDGQKLSFAVPPILSNGSFTLTFSVKARFAGVSLPDRAVYTVNDTELAQAVAVQNIGEVAGAAAGPEAPAPPGKVAGEQEALPRTGTDLNILLLFICAFTLGLLLGKINPRMIRIYFQQTRE